MKIIFVFIIIGVILKLSAYLRNRALTDNRSTGEAEKC
ncbi:MAG: hypothetical protein UW11_C0012G0009 [Parcubacteria group bacterium GW2011_GWA2_43_9b]|nr:MAG: hypothetical protein UW11_C0012G0009 [Parcubacteria group bacterium GW2011_GWA2_43_9b]